MIVDGWTGGQLFSNNVEGAGSGPATPCAFPMFDTDARHDRRQEKRSTMPTNAAPRSPKTTTRRCRHLALVLILLAALWPISAGAAVTLVKNIGKTGSTTTGTSLSVTVPAADVAAGNRVIVSVALDPTAGTVSCADSKGNVYAKDVDVTQGSGTSGVRSVIFSAPITAALVSGNTITVTHPSLAARAMSADEFSGLGTSGTLDKTASATGSSTSPSSGTTATTSQPSELLIGAIDVETRGDTFTVGSGYTSLASISSASNGNATSNVTMNAEYRIVSATGGYAANGTLGTARQWAAGIATYRAAACGNGIVDAGEQCDGGACCSATCTFLSSATVCRAAAGECGTAEFGPGTGPNCPADAKKPAGSTVCRAAAGACDIAETCTGSSSTCPADAFQPSTFTCRAAVNECDIAENCPGNGPNCPADVVKSAGTACTDDGNVCTTDQCNGTVGSPACIHPAGHAGDVCRSATGPCDIADTCDGLNNSCPPDGFLPATTVCRTAAGECDVTEYCTGTASDCPGDAKVAAGTSCTADGNVCTADECDGTSDLCRHTLVCPKPVANAGHNTSGLTGATITLDGSGSSDPDGGALTYQWSISSKPDGSNAALADPAVVTPTITPDLPGHYDMRLVVNNGRLDSDPATVTVAACVEMSAQELQTAASGGGWLATLQHAQSLGYSDIGPARSCPDGATSLIVATLTNAAGESVVLTHNQTFDTAFLLLPSATGSVTVFNETGGVVISPDGTTQTVAPDGHTATAQAADGSCKDYWLFVLCQAAQQFRTAFVTCGPWIAEAIACVLFSPDLVTKAYCLSVVAVANQQNILQCLFGTPQIGNPNCQDVSNGRNCPTGTVCATGGCFHGGCKLTPVADSTPCDADFYGVPRCLTSISFRDSALCVGGRCTPVTQDCEPCEVGL